tara:strand:+ start:100 stop:645 length:546 start_codon:yes stop_codon:yes gene_type:complete
MANIWPVYEGKTVTIGEPWARVPVSDAIALFELRPTDLVSDLEKTPRFGDTDRDLTYEGYKHIVVEVKRSETKRSNFKPGFYKSRIKPREAYRRLIQQAIVTELGDDNILYVEPVPTTNSQGHEALKIAITISPGADKRIKGEAILSALVKLKERLQDMRERRVPFMEYATEEERRLNASS